MSTTQHWHEAFAKDPEIVALPLKHSGINQARLDCLRLDQMHPFVSGNKWFKLRYHIDLAREHGKTTLLSFGGAFSNHLHALAYAGKQLGIATRAMVRGEPAEPLSPTLQDCRDWGMQLDWINREDYARLSRQGMRQSLAERYPDAWVIPEGAEGVAGICDLFTRLSKAGRLDYDVIACPVGSGTTLAGILAAQVPKASVMGFSALKGAHDLEDRIAQQLHDETPLAPWQVCHDYHFGGFAKMNVRLRDFISAIHADTGILFDPVYTGKMLFGVLECLHQGRIAADARVLVVHTGGLQGWRGFGESGPGIWNQK